MSVKAPTPKSAPAEVPIKDLGKNNNGIQIYREPEKDKAANGGGKLDLLSLLKQEANIKLDGPKSAFDIEVFKPKLDSVKLVHKVTKKNKFGMMQERQVI